ncbi:MAG: hypothetical protein J6Q68_04075 [Clostridia bacterium]|nr:hypothetical protein [Clostridia bacterium]
MKEYERFDRIGTEPHRSYYIPFGENDEIKRIYGIQDRTSSSRFISLDGTWQIKALAHVDDFCVRTSFLRKFPFPLACSCTGTIKYSI